MKTIITKSPRELGQLAAAEGAQRIRTALREQGRASIIVATGASQFEMLRHLVAASGIDWTKVTAFHLDEYVGLPIRDKASFRLYLWRRFVRELPAPIGAFHYINAETNPAAECRRLSGIIRKEPIDVAFIGIGENGHLAFNDPPANFKTRIPYLVVKLDEACRRQQVGEGWFEKFKDVPARAISMSIQHILKSRAIICSVPGQQKATAVLNSLKGPISPRTPASILQKHASTTIYLDKASAALLDR